MVDVVRAVDGQHRTEYLGSRDLAFEGQVFEYGRADDWARDAVAERATHPGWLSSFAIVEGAAFHLYSRGAVDYEP